MPKISNTKLSNSSIKEISLNIEIHCEWSVACAPNIIRLLSSNIHIIDVVVLLPCWVASRSNMKQDFMTIQITVPFSSAQNTLISWGKRIVRPQNSRESIGTIRIYRLSCTHRDQFVISVIGFYDLTASGHW